MIKKRQKFQKKSKQEGITLVALVITIIILIILATVAISFAFGSNGLINRAEDSRDMYVNDTAYTEESIVNVESYINEILIGEGEEKVLATKVDELKEGDYVYYEDGTNITRKCVVLYDQSSGFGTQIITMETVEEIICEGRLLGALNMYNDLINILNNATDKFLNEQFAISSRCVGSIPDNPNLDEAPTYSLKIGNYFEDVKLGDQNYKMDYIQLKKLGIYNIGKSYLFASRNSDASSLEDYAFYIHKVHEGDFIYVFTGKDLSYGSYTHNILGDLRPCFTLKPDLKIIGGDGEKDEPYILEAPEVP